MGKENSKAIMAHLACIELYYLHYLWMSERKGEMDVRERERETERDRERERETETETETESIPRFI